MNWPRRKLSAVAAINPKRTSIERQDSAKTSFVPMEAVNEVRGEITLTFTQPYSKVKKGYTYFENGDVIFAKITPCMQNGKHAVARNLIDGFGFGSTEFHVVRASDAILPEWIHHFLRRQQTLDAALKTFTGTVGQQRVPASFLEELDIPVPHVDVQREIADRLGAQLGEAVAAEQVAQQQAKDITHIRSRVLQEVFAGLQDVPRKILGNHAPTASGTTPSRGNKAYWSPAEVPWVKTGEVAFAPITVTEEAVSRLALKECSLSLLPPKSVLVAMIGQGKTRGQSALLEIEATTNQNCFAVLPSETWVPEFLYYWFVANYQNLRNLSSDRGGSQSALNGALLKALEVPAPDHATQDRIVQHVQAALAEVDTMQAASQQMLKDLEQLPQRILAQAFEN